MLKLRQCHSHFRLPRHYIAYFCALRMGFSAFLYQANSYTNVLFCFHRFFRGASLPMVLGLFMIMCYFVPFLFFNMRIPMANISGANPYIQIFIPQEILRKHFSIDLFGFWFGALNEHEYEEDLLHGIRKRTTLKVPSKNRKSNKFICKCKSVLEFESRADGKWGNRLKRLRFFGLSIRFDALILFMANDFTRIIIFLLNNDNSFSEDR